MSLKYSSIQLGDHHLEWRQRTYVMGILNVTPDSFSGDGLMDRSDPIEAALEQAQAQIAAGADLLDVGGESTRPGSQPVSLAEELARVIPVIQALAKAVSVPISVDTYKAEVARQGIAAGAVLVNDVWGLTHDPQMGSVVAESGAGVILMHNRSRSQNVQQQATLGGRYVDIDYSDLMAEIKIGLQNAVEQALQWGISPEKIILDPGIGFGKTMEQNFELIRRMHELKELGYPILAGPSRKSFVGYRLDLPADQRLEGTAAAVALCIDRGADLVRVHDVGPMYRVCRIADGIVRGF